MRYKIGLALLCLPLLATADPGAVTKRLMNDPVSLLDIGIYKMGVDLDENDKYAESAFRGGSLLDAGLFTSTVTYDWSDDKIRVSFYVQVEESEFGIKADHERLTKGCELVLKRAAIHADPLYLSVYFSHEGYSNKPVPDDWSEQIAGRMEFECKAHARHDDVAVIVKRTGTGSAISVTKLDAEEFQKILRQ